MSTTAQVIRMENQARSPEQRYTLETAVLGARMLGWPDRPLPPRS